MNTNSCLFSPSYILFYFTKKVRLRLNGEYYQQINFLLEACIYGSILVNYRQKLPILCTFTFFSEIVMVPSTYCLQYIFFKGTNLLIGHI